MTKKQFKALMAEAVDQPPFSWSGCSCCKTRCDEAKAMLAEGWTLDRENHWIDPQTGVKLTMEQAQEQRRMGVMVLTE